ncbi:TniQ family protein [Variovorax sp. LjRoot178]|uniref:TniQ family protein n=1 Tax=Variovorax sp. LjRoot178 TaxID=3342277 RepID=UPI003ECF91BB
MWQRRLPELPPWPVSPRPFPEEALGSWLGRVAARYRMSVQHLCDEHELRLDFETSRAGWLVLPVVADPTIRQLARLARLEEDRLQEIQTTTSEATNWRIQFYCARCLFLNPVDVAAPRWKRVWLDPEVTVCEVHGTPLVSVASSALHRCKNFDQTLKIIGRIELKRTSELPGLRDMRHSRH